MEKFLNIDWNPPLEDIIDNVFIRDSRLEKESVMHKSLIGTLTNPFEEIRNEYEQVHLNLSECDSDILKRENKNDETKTNETMEEKGKTKFKNYVPGILKPSFKFPRMSSLNKEEQAMCLRVILRFSDSKKPKLTQQEREELQKYTELQQAIKKEQDEFLNVAKSMWHTRSFKLFHDDYINAHWKSKVDCVRSLPRFYTEVMSIPLSGDKDISVQHVADCLHKGNLSKVQLPILNLPCYLHIRKEQLIKAFPPVNYTTNDDIEHYKLPVSDDPYCQRLAEENNVDLVISSSGLNCLVNNVGPKYPNTWIIPVVVRKHNDKNIIYINKTLPPTTNTIPVKNTWVHKYILRYWLVQKNNTKTEILQDTDVEDANSDDIFGGINSEELMKLEEECEQTIKPSKNDVSKQRRKKNEANAEQLNKMLVNESGEEAIRTGNKMCLKEIKKKSDTVKAPDKNQQVDGKGNQNIQQQHQTEAPINALAEESSADTDQYVSYRIFVIGSNSSEQNELMKNGNMKSYKILVRSKTDGFEVLENGEVQPVILAPKLEHQMDLGAEAVTLEESLKQWVSLLFRPSTSLIRVRMSATRSEVLQFERRTATSLNNEIKRLYNVKVDELFNVFYNVIQHLSPLAAGNYIMRHTTRNGAFATVSKEASGPGKGILDVLSVYDGQYHTVPKAAWIPIDKIVVTPALKCFERMPAMFYPKRTVVVKKKEPNKQQPNTGSMRKSTRNIKKTENLSPGKNNKS